MCLRSFTVSEKLHVKKTATVHLDQNCMGTISPTVVDRMYSNTSKGLKLTIFLLQDTQL
jgi:hypothetical protein